MSDEKRPSKMERKNSIVGESLYRVLDIDKKSDQDQIKKAYRKKALRLHPDKNPGNPEAADQFKEVNRAHKILSDVQLRDIYDKYGSMGLELAEQIGAENVAMVMRFQTPAAKIGMLLTFVLTGCCCGCCFCCFFCCGCCFGRCRPKDVEDEEFGDLIPEDDEEAGAGYNSYQQNASDGPITVQPPAPEAEFKKAAEPIPLGPS